MLISPETKILNLFGPQGLRTKTLMKISSPEIRPVKISESREISPGSFLISFPRPFSFKAGQVIGICLEENGPRRLYSICSGEAEDEMKILYKVVDEGYLTPRLSDRKAGDEIWITPAGGEFTGDRENAVWIATGTGIAPFYSMLRSGLGGGKNLIHGSRKISGFYFADEFSDRLGKNFVRCCSAEQGDGILSGRVTDYIRELEELDTELKYYLCGSAEMVVETRDLLISRGVPFGSIVSEIYF